MSGRRGWWRLVLAGVALFHWSCSAAWAVAPDTVVGPEGVAQKGVIRFATQPLAIPTGVVPEVMKRDALLREDLALMGMAVQFSAFANGEEINHQIKAGMVDAAVSGDAPTVVAMVTLGMRALALSKMAFASLVTRRALPISAFRGKRIAYVKGSTSQQMLLTALWQAGLQENDVTLVEMPVHLMTEALEQEEVDAFAAWEPTPTIALQSHPEFSVAHRAMSHSFLTLSSTFIQQRGVASKRLLAAYMRAINWMAMDNQNLSTACNWTAEAAAKLTGKASKGTLEQCMAITRRDLIDPAPDARIPTIILKDGASVHQVFAFLQKLGKIPQNVSWETARSGFNLELHEVIVNSPYAHKLWKFSYDGLDEGVGIP